MQLQTTVVMPKSRIRIGHSDGIVLLGSCFADNIGMRLKSAKFNTLCNPFGTLYNPASIAWHLDRCMDAVVMSDTSDDLFVDGVGIWHSWMHHTSFSAPDEHELSYKINHAWQETSNALRRAKTLIVTFGTAIVYTLSDSGRIVANCHKQPDSLFKRRWLSPEEISGSWMPIIQRLKTINPDIDIIFTVSPIRHKRDGLHANQVSKATLLLAVDRIIQEAQSISGTGAVEYFPSYEIMMDELRDYRFYADDMIHPSELAVEYIWEKVSDTYMDRPTKELMSQLGKITKALQHRPIGPDTQTYHKFIGDTSNIIDNMRQQHPYIDLDKEKEICNTLLEKYQA